MWRSTAPNGAARPGRRSLARRASPGSMSQHSARRQRSIQAWHSSAMRRTWLMNGRRCPRFGMPPGASWTRAATNAGHFCSRARPRSKARGAAMFVIPARVGSPVCQCAPWPCVSRATASRSCRWQASLRARALPLSVARARWMTSPAGAAGAVGLQTLGFRKSLRERRQASTCTRCSTSTCWMRACRPSLHTAFCELLP